MSPDSSGNGKASSPVVGDSGPFDCCVYVGQVGVSSSGFIGDVGALKAVSFYLSLTQSGEVSGEGQGG